MSIDTRKKLTNRRIIHTGFYSTEMKNLLDWFFSYLTNCTNTYENGKVAAVERAPDGEVLISLAHHDGRYWTTVYAKKHTDALILDWIAWMLKNIACQHIQECWRDYTTTNDKKLGIKLAKKALWTRDNDGVVIPVLTTDTDYVSVSDIYFIYESFKGRKNIERKYSNKLIKKWRGEKRDPLATEMEMARREEVERINKEYDMKVFEATPEYDYTMHNLLNRNSQAYTELNRIIREFKAKCNETVDNLIAERDRKIEELNAMMYLPKN